MKKRIKLMNHIIHCQWSIKYGLPKGKKSYYFIKQIEKAEKLLRKL